jgi:Tol biopolymer transport system component
MNLWRVAIDETTGATSGAPEPVTFGSASGLHSASVSSDGRRIVYVASVEFNTIRRADLDLAAGRAVVAPPTAARAANVVLWIEVSPDGRSLAYTTIGTGEHPGLVREEIIVATIDGSSRRRVAASDSRNRMPAWSPAGDRIAFASDRSGSYMLYTVRSDGSDLAPLDVGRKEVIYPVWSPEGDRIAYATSGKDRRVLIARVPRGDTQPDEIPAPEGGKTEFVPVSWSPDGSAIAGQFATSGVDEGIHLYHIASRTYERLTERGIWPLWLGGNRQILYMMPGIRSLFVLDVATRKVRELPVDFRGMFEFFGVTVTRDGRSVYIVEEEQDADLWMLERKH